ncbi:peptidoglycan DD-metalloendopeptidase family protein [Microbacterium sp. NPDC089318]
MRRRLFVLMLSLALLAGDGADETSEVAGYPWQWPVAGAHTVVEPFRAPAHEYGPGHRGMDVAVAEGAEVAAPAPGVVAFRGRVVDRPLITIDHGDGHVSTWEPVSSALSPGDLVLTGDPIGAVASGGHAVRGTMHIGVRRDGAYINPMPLFGEVSRAILLPCCQG